MSPRLAIARLEGSIYRVARRPDAWAWPDWASVNEDGTFGSRYLSRLGDELVNWAIFEPNVPSDATSEAIDPDDEALRAVFDRFDLTWD
jgi:hypothetical protein